MGEMFEGKSQVRRERKEGWKGREKERETEDTG